MPYEAAYTASGVALRFSGAVTGAEVLRANAELYAHPYQEALRYCFFDLTEATRFDVDAETIERAAEQDKLHLANQPEVLVAIVAPEPLHFGLARMWEAHVDGAPIRAVIVKSRAEALAFLHLHGVDV